MADKRKKYTKKFKLDAIRLLEAGTKPGHETERDLGIGSGQIYRWAQAIQCGRGTGFPRQQQVARRGVGRLAQREQGVARGTGRPAKSNSHLLQTLEMKYAFMSEQRGALSVEKMAKVLGATRSGYHAWRDGCTGGRSLEKEALIREIRAIQNEMHHRYGCPRVTEELRRRGRRVGCN